MSESKSTAVTRRSSSDLTSRKTLAEYKALINGALDEAAHSAEPYQRTAGRYLAEVITAYFTLPSGAMDRVGAQDWLKKNIQTQQGHRKPPAWRTAVIWMRFAGAEFQQAGSQVFLSQPDMPGTLRKEPRKSVEEFKREIGLSGDRGDRWENKIRPKLASVNVDRMRQQKTDAEKEEKLIRSLGLKLVDIGYTALAQKLHPDKGGSGQAMARLNEVRRRLKAAL